MARIGLQFLDSRFQLLLARRILALHVLRSHNQRLAIMRGLVVKLGGPPDLRLDVADFPQKVYDRVPIGCGQILHLLGIHEEPFRIESGRGIDAIVSDPIVVMRIRVAPVVDVSRPPTERRRAAGAEHVVAPVDFVDGYVALGARLARLAHKSNGGEHVFVALVIVRLLLEAAFAMLRGAHATHTGARVDEPATIALRATSEHTLAFLAGLGIVL